MAVNEYHYRYWPDGRDGLIPIWMRVVLFPILLVGFWGVLLLSRLVPYWWGDGWIGAMKEAPIIWWRMIRYGAGVIK